MSTLTSKPILIGILFIFTLLSGLLVSNAGRPLNSGLFAIHKLVAVATTILLGVSIYQQLKSGSFLTAVGLLVLVLTAALFLALFISGALLSFEIELPWMVLKVHQVAPLLSLAFSAATVYLLINNPA